MLGLVGFAVAIWFIPGHQEIDNNDIDTATAEVLNLAITGNLGQPTDPAWNAVVDAEPGNIATGHIHVVNNNGSFALDADMTTVNTNPVLAGAYLVRIGTATSVAACDFPYHNPDGSTTALVDDVEMYAGPLEGAALTLNTLADPWETYLCFSVVFPTTETNNVALSNQQNTSTFMFDIHFP